MSETRQTTGTRKFAASAASAAPAARGVIVATDVPGEYREVLTDGVPGASLVRTGGTDDAPEYTVRDDDLTGIGQYIVVGAEAILL